MKDSSSLNVAVTVQEDPPGEFRYWLVHMRAREDGRDSFYFTGQWDAGGNEAAPHASADAAWAAGVAACKAALADERGREREAEIRNDVRAAVEELKKR